MEGTRRAGWSAWAPAFAAALLLCLPYAPLFWGRVLYFRDISGWILPARWFVRQALGGGQWPTWNPDVALGFSVAADPLYGLFYPPNLLSFVGSPAWATSFASFAHLLFGAVGMFLLARRLDCRTAAASVAALAWGLSGHTTASWTAGILLLAAAWIPWIALGLVRVVLDGPSRDRIVWAALPVAWSLLLGEVFLSALGIGLGTLLALAAGAFAARPAAQAATNPPVRRARLLAAVGAAVALGALGSAGAVLPALAVAGDTERAARLDKARAEVGSLHPARLVELAAPGVFGDPFTDYPGELLLAEPHLDNRPLFDSVYLGSCVLALALAALGRRRRLAWAIAGLAAVAVLVALGRHTPAHGLFRLLPPFGYMRHPEKYLALAVPCVALLAALGTERLLAEAGVRRRFLALAAALAAAAVVARFTAPAPIVPYMQKGTLLAAGLVLVTWGATMFATRRPREGAFVLVLLVGADLALAARPILLFITPSLLEDEPALARTIAGDAAARGEIAAPRLFRSRRLEPYLAQHRPRSAPFEEVQRQSVATLTHNGCTMHGIATTEPYDAAVPERYWNLWRRGKQEGFDFLRLTSTAYLLVPAEGDLTKKAAGAGLELLSSPLGRAHLYRVPDALPRVYLAARAEAVDDVAAYERVWDDDVVSGQAVLLAPGAASAAFRGPPAQAGDGCRLTIHEPRRLRATCRSGAAGLAVFVEQSDPGWRARVDGAPAPTLRANLVMRAVPVPAGEHVVELEHAPPALAAAAVTTGLVHLFGLALLLVERRRRRKVAVEPD